MELKLEDEENPGSVHIQPEGNWLSLSHLKKLGWDTLEATLRHEMVHCWLFLEGQALGT
ncbi:hypothetical protein [Candidatus Hakubella thermalkaliphila]|uniref:hypothetical protein n=1 Tax=Candidatus Hakubella thermalkaliphila TaxID=2754717 RepID=UPI0015937E13|nr:hypothetical protein [Candidatus Hakubella thermalkaliphila]